MGFSDGENSPVDPLQAATGLLSTVCCCFRARRVLQALHALQSREPARMQNQLVSVIPSSYKLQLVKCFCFLVRGEKAWIVTKGESRT